MLNSGFVEFKLDYSKAKDFAIGDAVYSGNFSASGHVWRIKCYPRGHGTDMDDSGEYLALYLELVTQATNVTAVFDAFLLRRNRCVHAYPPAGFSAWGWSHFARLRDLESPDHLQAGDGRRVTFVCGVIVLRGAVPPPPPDDVASHLGRILDSGDGSDVAFSVGGETFRAHRAVLAARSPVLKVALLGPMAEATMPTITRRDIEPDTFGAMLRFMYTDTLPDQKDLAKRSSSPSAEFFQALLAAADQYALDALKLVCAQRLCDIVSVDNVPAILGCAEVHGCPELKSRCLDFFMEEKNFRKVVPTQGYLQLIQSFPSLVDEIKARVEDQDRCVLPQKTWESFSFSVARARYLDPWIQKLVDALSD